MIEVSGNVRSVAYLFNSDKIYGKYQELFGMASVGPDSQTSYKWRQNLSSKAKSLTPIAFKRHLEG
jgi:hypothetical protein